MNNILVGVDITPKSRAIIDYALQLAAKTGGKVTLLHVVNNLMLHTATFPDPLGNMENMNMGTDLTILEEQQKASEEYLGKLEKELLYPVETKVLFGVPDDVLPDYAEEINADLLVIGTHASSGLTRFLEGDLSASVLHHTKVPLLIVPTGSAK